ncbi:MAG TPA: tRNA uracil 4-sulfurtransferase ThiI [Candidatus Binataceae bacterium]|nr:tRNA uracil 4-sulfurtransferase ThiI [Candidatus Binataceae bacterium]
MSIDEQTALAGAETIAAAGAPARRYLIGRYHEIVLKGGNRWRFVEQLKRNLRALFVDCRIGRIRSEGPRLIIEMPAAIPEALMRERAALLFGFQNFTVSHPVALEIEALKREAVAAARGYRARTFRISTRRADKRFALNSMEIDRIVGAEVAAALGLKVDLEQPELTITIEILPDSAYMAIGKDPGAGGLPAGISGRATVLLSGGIDSPVAAYRMMRRGLHVDFVHFHSHPLVSAASREKALELAAHLTRYEAHATLALVPFAEIQREIVARTLRPLRVVLYRRFMLRIASEIARRSGSAALITGESLGQVASQTLENMTVIEKAAALPVLRPLLGMDKNEIVVEARRLGTFETSILPDQDCCSLFVPAHPETHARLAEVVAAEAQLDLEAMVAATVAKTETVALEFPHRRVN